MTLTSYVNNLKRLFMSCSRLVMNYMMPLRSLMGLTIRQVHCTSCNRVLINCNSNCLWKQKNWKRWLINQNVSNKVSRSFSCRSRSMSICCTNNAKIRSDIFVNLSQRRHWQLHVESDQNLLTKNIYQQLYMSLRAECMWRRRKCPISMILLNRLGTSRRGKCSL